MDTNGSEKKGLLENPFSSTLIAIATFILILGGIIFLANQFETLEDKLQYREPQVLSSTAGETVTDPANQRYVYVPVYSHIYASGGEPKPLETTLSIRNVERSHSIQIDSVRYYDSQGKYLKEYLDGVLILEPLQTSDFLVLNLDHSGGSGANFIVSWNAEVPVQKPIIEAIMVGHQISFISQGRVLTSKTNEEVAKETQE